MAAKNLKTAMRISGIKKVENRKVKETVISYTLSASDKDKVAKIKFISDAPFDGYKEGEVIDVTIGTSQVPLTDFTKKEKKK